MNLIILDDRVQCQGISLRNRGSIFQGQFSKNTKHLLKIIDLNKIVFFPGGVANPTKSYLILQIQIVLFLDSIHNFVILSFIIKYEILDRNGALHF